MMIPCKYFITATGCGRGSTCQYSHDTTITKHMPDLILSLISNDENQPPGQNSRPIATKLIACRFLAKGHCQKGEDCPFSHGIEPATPSQKPSATPLCSFFARGRCQRGNNCPFSHEIEVKTSSQTPVRTTCIFFARGKCTKGSDCLYLHNPIVPDHNETKPPDTQHTKKTYTFSSTAIDTSSAVLDVPSAVTKNYDNVQKGMIARAISGALTIFEDGGKVYKISVPSDFTTIRITGLPQDTNIEYIETMLARLDLGTYGTCIRITSIGTPPSVLAYLRIEDSTVGSILSEKLESGWRRFKMYSELKASPVPTSLFPVSGFSSEFDFHEVFLTWYRSSKMAVLKYANEDVANMICNNFNNGYYRVVGKHLACDSPIISHILTDQKHRFLCILKNVPVFADKEDILGAMDEKYRPDELEIGRPSYEASDEVSREYVRKLSSAIGPVESWDPVQDPTAKRVKVRVRFQDESGAREAIAQLNNRNIEILGKGKIMAQQIISTRFKVVTKIYSAVQSQVEDEKKSLIGQRITIRAYPSTDVAKKFTTLKIDGEPGENFTNAKNKLEKILIGTVALVGGKPVWNDYFMQPIGLMKIKRVADDYNVVIDRDRARQQLRLYGLPRDIDSAQHTLHRIVTSEVEGYAIKLTPSDFLWVAGGGFDQIVSVLGKDVASIDILSNPKKILLAGNLKNYHTAMAVLKSRSTAAGRIDKMETGEDKDNCSVCWYPSEYPIRTNCGHLYCLQCFEHLCSLTIPSDQELSINCKAIGCDVVLSLQEIEQNLPSKSFEQLLNASFTSYIRHHRNNFHYCPTEDCEQVYRVNIPTKSRTCAKCLVETCIPCHASHQGQTCADYKNKRHVRAEAHVKDEEECANHFSIKNEDLGLKFEKGIEEDLVKFHVPKVKREMGFHGTQMLERIQQELGGW
ncbi:uncharacterized protein EAF02_000473 [Botrytis sinoallii]|uniref:uncharacterized protein n=1 Tax=Botrytis sinoallii TaxID=1463999 RepID=UPI0018FF99B7|nr:uncharacterized protein EAF02_000473 [Botrytis sinoallii]KAF7892935.1 hypothetical protein EAF02_000473 [Botrytis sinoallii]